ncbi:MAG: AAA family ATPase, partial [Chloroflexota bacterium]
MLKKYRNRIQLTQKELSESTSFTSGAYGHWESGRSKPNWENLKELILFFVEKSAIETSEEVEAILDCYDYLDRMSPTEIHHLFISNRYFSIESIPNEQCVGRTREREAIIQHFEQNERFISLIGFGGLGKTRLAYEVAKKYLSAYGDVCFILLENKSFMEGLGQILDVYALGSNDSQSYAPRARSERGDLYSLVLNQLSQQDKDTLLVLDNCEHLQDGNSYALLSNFILDVLRRVPHVKILLTSRSPLNHKNLNEREFYIEALGFPQEDDVSDLAAYPAVQLLMLQAAKHGFQLSSKNEAYIAKICRELEGWPLAIELAGALIKDDLTCEGLATELPNISSMTPSFQAQESKHRHSNLKTIFEYDWQLFSKNQQAFLKQLAPLPTYFDEDVVMHMCHSLPGWRVHLNHFVSIRIIEQNHIKGIGTFYSFHGILQDLIADKLALDAGLKNGLSQQMSAYYLKLLQDMEGAIKNKDDNTKQKISLVQKNIEAGFTGALLHDNSAVIKGYVDCLSKFYTNYSLNEEAFDFYNKYLEKVDVLFFDYNDQPNIQHTRANWWHHFGKVCYQLGRQDLSEIYLRKALQILDRDVLGPYQNSSQTYHNNLWAYLLQVLIGLEFLKQILYFRRPSVQKFITPVIIFLFGRNNRTNRLSEAAYVYEDLAQVYYFLSDDFRTQYTSLRGLNLAEFAGNSKALAKFYATALVGISTDPRLRNLVSTYQKLSFEEADKLKAQSAQGYQDVYGWVLTLVSHYHIGMGHLSDGEKFISEAVRFNREAANLRRLIETQVNLLNTYQFRGDFKTAMKIWREIRNNGYEQGDKQAIMWSVLGEINQSVSLGQEISVSRLIHQMRDVLVINQDKISDSEVENAIYLMERIMQECIKIGDKTTIPNYISFKALVYLRNANYDRTHSAVGESLQVLKSSPITTYTNFTAYSCTAEASLRLLEKRPTAEHLKMAKQACGYMDNFARAFPVGRLRANIWSGLYQWLNGNQEKAFTQWTASLKLAENQGFEFDKGLLLYELGLRKKDKSNLMEAAKLFETLNA